VPDALDAIVMKALQRDREQRYRSAADMARDLDELVLASRLRVDEVQAFVRSIEAETRPSDGAGPSPARRRELASVRACTKTRQLVRGPALGNPDAPTVPQPGAPRRMTTVRRRLWTPARRRTRTIAGVALLAAALATAVGLRVNITATKNVARAADSSTSVPPPRRAPPP
jgi:hypothetical protein